MESGMRREKESIYQSFSLPLSNPFLFLSIHMIHAMLRIKQKIVRKLSSVSELRHKT